MKLHRLFLLKCPSPQSLLIAALALPCLADNPIRQFNQVQATGRSHFFHIDWANDEYLGKDYDFTNGIELTLGKGSARQHDSNGELFRARAEWQLGQHIYTPRHTQWTPEHIPENERPYAGWLYFGAGLSKTYTNEVYQRQFFAIGCTGPCSQAEQVQRLGHNAVGVSEPRGWDTQIRNQLTVHYSYEYRWPAWHNAGDADLRLWDLAPGYRLQLGNVIDSVEFSLLARLALGPMDSYFQATDIYESGAQPIDASLFQPREFYWYGQVMARAVAYNALIQGGWLEDDSPVTQSIEHQVFELDTGLVLNWGRHKLQLYYRARSPEFHHRGERSRNARWLGLSATYFY